MLQLNIQVVEVSRNSYSTHRAVLEKKKYLVLTINRIKLFIIILYSLTICRNLRQSSTCIRNKKFSPNICITQHQKHWGKEKSNSDKYSKYKKNFACLEFVLRDYRFTYYFDKKCKVKKCFMLMRIDYVLTHS